MSSNENISVMKEHIFLFALLFESRRPSLYEQQRDAFIDQVIVEIWAFQQRVFGLGDPLDSSTIGILTAGMFFEDHGMLIL